MSASMADFAAALKLTGAGVASSGELVEGSDGGVRPALVVRLPRRSLGRADSSSAGCYLCDDQAGVPQPCGGLIGGATSGRFCCKPSDQCKVAIHKRSSFAVTAGHAYIRCPPSGGGPSAYCEPSLDMTSISIPVREYLLDETRWVGRPSADLVNAFTSLVDLVGATSEEQMAVMESLDKQVPWGVATPTATRERDSAFFADPNQFTDDASLASGNAGSTQGPRFMPDYLDNTVSSEERIEFMTENWNPMLHHVDKVENQGLEALSTLEGRIRHIKGTLGVPPSGQEATLPSPQVWPCIAQACVEANRLAVLADVESRKLNTQMFQMEQLRRENSELKTRLDEADAKAEAMTGMLGILFSDYQARTSSSTAGVGASPGTAGMSHDDVDRKLQVALGGFKAQLSTLQLSVAAAKAQPGNLSVTLAGTVFHTPHDLAPWVIANHGERVPVALFPDAISMFEMAANVGATSAARTANQGIHKKAGHDDVESGTLLNSYCTLVPAIFIKGRTGSLMVSMSDDHKDWDKGDGMTGVGDRINAAIDTWESHMNVQIRAHTPDYGGAVDFSVLNMLATRLVLKSKAFWDALKTWISRFYGRLMVRVDSIQGPVGNQSRKDFDLMVKMNGDEAWALVSQVLTDIFAEFLRIRAPGVPAINMDPGAARTATVLFGALRAHQFMDELVAAQFERHPCLSPSLNNFCITNRASIGETQRLEAKMTLVQKSQSDLKGEFDKKFKK
jgi:hypothetical protein